MNQKSSVIQILKSVPRVLTSDKVPVSIRLSPEVVAHFKAGGPGWQGRIDDALRKIVQP